jgi:hypothetical protein
MSTERLVNWSKESKEFFLKEKIKSIILDILYLIFMPVKQLRALKI